MKTRWHWRLRKPRRGKPWQWRGNYGRGLRQSLCIWLLEHVPHPEVDCGAPESAGRGVHACNSSARSYICRRHCVEESRDLERKLIELGQL